MPRSTELIQIYQLKVTLRGAHKPIWRQFQVRGDITLGKLHRILQAVMGWTDAHLHQFLIRGKQYGTPEGAVGLHKTMDEHKHRLRDVVPVQASPFTYEYDFGDGWKHELLVENILAPQEGVRYPVCLMGTRACPPEDVGGITGYENFLEAINNPRHPEHQEYMEWIGDSFDPEAFDADEVNRKLHRLK
ncbi:MAG: plasmid pRiA4b ORF-3 family protein [Terriglobales bacterium]